MAFAALGDELTCSICLSLYDEPVSLKCGHNFCQNCIVTVLDTQEKSRYYSCPECTEKYTERPVLEKNRKLCKITEIFQSTQPKTEKTKIFCTYCVDSPLPASKTCLHCETSMCDKHLMAHNKSVEHVLMEPTTSFAEMKCSIHREILKYYCTKDNVCICMSCWVAGDHVGHKMELLNEAYENMKEKLKDDRVKRTHDREEVEKRIQNLENHCKKEEDKAAEVTGRVTEVFRDIRRQLDDEEKRVLTEVSRQKEQISQSVSNLIKELEIQKNELCKTVGEIEGFLDITDPLTLLRANLRSNDISVSGDTNSDIRDAGCLDEVMISLMLHRRLLLFIENVKQLKKSQQFLVTENSDVLLDRNTANNKSITISQDLRSATYVDNCQRNLIDQEMLRSTQVLSTRSFSLGKHYWEVDVSGAEEWLIGVASRSIERKATESKMFLDSNDKSQATGINEKQSGSIFSTSPAFVSSANSSASLFGTLQGFGSSASPSASSFGTSPAFGYSSNPSASSFGTSQAFGYSSNPSASSFGTSQAFGSSANPSSSPFGTSQAFGFSEKLPASNFGTSKSFGSSANPSAPSSGTSPATGSNEKPSTSSGAFGFNDKSWAIKFFGELTASHNNVHQTIVSDSRVETVGVYMDYEAGRLSFYQLCEPIKHLHTFTATFTEPLHAAFTVGKSSCVRIIP